MSLSRADLEKQSETNLIGMLSNPNVPDEDRLYAAVLLYKRGSRFLAYQEYAPYKNRVLDFILAEYAATPPQPFAPNLIQDLAGRLHIRHSAIQESLNASNQLHLTNRDRDRMEHQNNLAIVSEDNDQDHCEFDNKIQTLSEDSDSMSEEIDRICGDLTNAHELLTLTNLRISRLATTFGIIMAGIVLSEIAQIAWVVIHGLKR